MINNLWIMSDPTENFVNNKWLMISAALKELSKFDKSAFKCSLLPNFVKNILIIIFYLNKIQIIFLINRFKKS